MPEKEEYYHKKKNSNKKLYCNVPNSQNLFNLNTSNVCFDKKLKFEKYNKSILTITKNIDNHPTYILLNTINSEIRKILGNTSD